MIVIVDYNMGNLRSVSKAIELVGGEVSVSSEPKDLERADKIVLPGVGAFAEGMEHLQQRGLVAALNEQVIQRKKPFLGICLGMQLLAKRSFEFGETEGLGWVDAEILRFDFPDRSLRVPHMGWNDITVVRDCYLFFKIQTGNAFYFVHSYFMRNKNPEDVIATCDYGGTFTAAIQKENIIATQFHPEKSQEKGLDILQEFVHSEINVGA